jgi:hypothetical protein
MVDHTGHIPVVLLVRDLIDTDPPQAGQPVDGLAGVAGDPGHDRPDRAPRNAHQLTDGGPGRVHRQPRHLVIEGVGVPGAVTGPRHGDHGGSMLAAIHPRRVGLQLHPRRAGVQRPPPPPPLTRVIPRRPPATTAAALPGTLARPHVHDQQLARPALVKDGALHDRTFDTQQPLT